MKRGQCLLSQNTAWFSSLLRVIIYLKFRRLRKSTKRVIRFILVIEPRQTSIKADFHSKGCEVFYSWRHFESGPRFHKSMYRPGDLADLLNLDKHGDHFYGVSIFFSFNIVFSFIITMLLCQLLWQQVLMKTPNLSGSICRPLEMPIRFLFRHTFEIFLANFLVDFTFVIVLHEVWSEI